MAAPGKDTPRTLEPAGFPRRFGAILIDWAACTLVGSLIVDPRDSIWPPLGVLVVLNAICLAYFGNTPGMLLAGIRCLSIVDGGALGPRRAFVRAVLLGLVIPAVVMDADQRGLHDRAAHSVVVRKTP